MKPNTIVNRVERIVVGPITFIRYPISQLCRQPNRRRPPGGRRSYPNFARDGKADLG
jgi:hypothetical protein